MVLLRIHCSNRKDHNDNTSKGSNYSNATPETSNKGNLLTILIIDMGMGQYPVLSRGANPPPLLQTLVAPALFQTFVARNYYMMDLVAPALSFFVTNFVARGAPRPCYKAEGFDPLPYCGYNNNTLLIRTNTTQIIKYSSTINNNANNNTTSTTCSE